MDDGRVKAFRMVLSLAKSLLKMLTSFAAKAGMR